MNPNSSRKLPRPLRAALFLLAGLLLGALIAAVVIAEPWAEDPQTSTLAPTETDLGHYLLAVGEAYDFELSLGQNEVISSIESDFPRAVEPVGYGVLAGGAVEEAHVTVTTREAVLSHGGTRILLFGKDYSRPYYNLRRSLRSFLGIQNAYTLPTELRVIRIFHYTFSVTSYPTAEQPALSVEQGHTIHIPTKNGEDFYTSLSIANPALVSALFSADSSYAVTGLSPGQTQVTVTYGFYEADPKAAPGSPPVFCPVYAKVFPITVSE